jgi:osmotically-inducible protein OsmY
MRKLLTGLGLGWLAAWFLDPAEGTRRRNVTRDRTAGTIRRVARRARRAGRGVAAQAYGKSRQAAHRHEVPKDYDDVTLARKVETELFRPADAPKGQVVVNAENGTVVLRGEGESRDLIEQLVERARQVQGVGDVENLLHVPGEPAPTHG